MEKLADLYTGLGCVSHLDVPAACGRGIPRSRRGAGRNDGGGCGDAKVVSGIERTVRELVNRRFFIAFLPEWSICLVPRDSEERDLFPQQTAEVCYQALSAAVRPTRHSDSESPTRFRSSQRGYLDECTRPLGSSPGRLLLPQPEGRWRKPPPTRSAIEGGRARIALR
jgi:hypothetical protein